MIKKIFGRDKTAVLIGGGDLLSKRQDNINKFILSFPNKRKVKILYVAAGLDGTITQESINNYLKRVKKRFEELSGKKVIIEVVTNKITKHEFVSGLNISDVVYMAGGDTQHLINFLKANQFDREIKKFWQLGKLIVGNSAGALSLVKTGISLLNKPKKYQGIGVIKNLIPVVHYNNNKLSTLENLLGEELLKTFAIHEDEAIALLGKQIIKIK